MRAGLLGVVVCALLLGGRAGAEQQSDCVVAISPPGVPAQVVGIHASTVPIAVLEQRDSPLAIMSADLSGLTVTAGPGSFTRSGRHVVDVKNVSSAVITGARIWVMVGFGPGSGVGSGTRVQRSLQPGEQARLEWNAGSGHGTDGAGRDVSIVALVHEVQVGSCTVRPEQEWFPRAESR